MGKTGTEQYIQKYRRPVKNKRTARSLRLMRIRRMVKSLRLLKIRRMVKSLLALKSPRLAKYPRLWKYWWIWKSKWPAYCLGSGRISNCWLLPGAADEHVLLLINVMNLACSLQVRGELLPPCFYGWTLSCTVPARHAKKWSKFTWQPEIRRPPGIPLIPVKTQQSLTLLKSVLSLNKKSRITTVAVQYHTHDLQIRGHPQDLPLQPQTVQRGRGVKGGGAMCDRGEGGEETIWCLLSGIEGGGGRSQQPNNVLFPTALMFCTVLLLISLSPISVRLWKPLPLQDDLSRYC